MYVGWGICNCNELQRGSLCTVCESDKEIILQCSVYQHVQNKDFHTVMPLLSGGILVCPFLSLSQSKQISPAAPWVGSEVKPDTGRHGVTGLGHLDSSPKGQMLAAAV